MLNSSFELKECKVQPIENDFQAYCGAPIPPIERVSVFSPKQFEDFINEWATSCLSTRYIGVYKIGGAKDKGRDIIAEITANEFDYFQCKHYENAIAPSDIWVEFGKLCYYTYKMDYPVPQHYYIVAPKDIGPTLLDLINNPKKINGLLVKNWDKYCKTEIKTDSSDLTAELIKYINDFNFKIVSLYPMQTILNEYCKTPFFPFRFGGGLTKKRPKNQNPPDVIDEHELTYITKIIAAYSDYIKMEIDSVNDLYEKQPQFIADFNRHRERFYSADSLRVFVRETLPDESSFTKLKNEIFDGIIDIIEKDYSDGKNRLINVMAHVSQLSIQDSILTMSSYVSICDKQGLCHHLANEKSEVCWVR